MPGIQSPWFSHQHDAVYINDNTIILFDDGNVRHATDPNAVSRGQEYVLDESTMTATLVVNDNLGTYSLALGAAQVLPNGNLDFTSGYLGTPPNQYGQTVEFLPDGAKTFTQQVFGIDEYRSYLMSNLYGSNLEITPANTYDPGFEYPIEGTGTSAYQLDPSASTWTFTGTAGVAGNGSAFTSGNANAPQASQVALIQKTGTISQSVDFYPAAGSYTISFYAAQRTTTARARRRSRFWSTARW